MSDSGHERWGEEVAAYMLGALEPEDVAEFEHHLEGCERCRSEVRWLTAAVEVLPEAVERHEPPPQLRERLLAEVGADARAAGTHAEPAERGALHRAGRRLAGLGSGPRDWRRLAWLGAMLLLVVAIGGYEIGSGGGDSGGGGGYEAFVSGDPPGVTAEVIREDDEGEIHLAAVGSLPSNRVLEAWVRRDGEIEPVKALFVPDGEGDATTALGDMHGVDLVMVTTEPAGGSASPTSAPIAEVPIT
jgi:anti-sigma-K factor RskA